MPASPDLGVSGCMTISSHASATSTPCPLIVRGMYATVFTAASSGLVRNRRATEARVEIGPVAEVAPCRAGVKLENQNGPAVLACRTPSKLLHGPLDRRFDVGIGVARQRQPNADQPAIAQLHRRGGASAVGLSAGGVFLARFPPALFCSGSVRVGLGASVGPAAKRLSFHGRAPTRPHGSSDKKTVQRKSLTFTCGDIANHSSCNPFQPA